jgi:ribose transport system substrate-binding protein
MARLLLLFIMTLGLSLMANESTTIIKKKKLAYLVSDIRIPFWEIMSRGIKAKASELGYEVVVYSASNKLKNELANTAQAIKSGVNGLIISPISSSSAVTILKFAQKAKTPVVISDIGTKSGEYVSFVSSNNIQGAYELGKILTKQMKELHLENGTVGIVAIPQKRSNGQKRTAGFMQALNEAGVKASGLRQQKDFSYKETYEHAKALIKNDTNLKALWLQGSNRYQGALDAIADSGKKGEILLICFDAEPEFLSMIRKGELVGSAMQQPFLMGENAVMAIDAKLNGKDVKKNIELPILAISKENIQTNAPIIQRNVLGILKK